MVSRPQCQDDGRLPAGEPSKAPLNRADFAWEFLRRNPRYRLVARASLATRGDMVEEEAIAASWGLQFLIDPDLPAAAADVFWRPEVAPGLVVRLQHVPAGTCGPLPDSVARAIRRRAPNGLHLKFASGFQAYIPDGDLAPPLAVAIPITGTFSTHLRAANDLERALDGRRPKAGDLTVQQHLRLTRSLQAVDGRARGLSYRLIASEVFGEAAVERYPWRASPVRDTAIRLVRSGVSLVGGAYVKLLKLPV